MLKIALVLACLVAFGCPSMHTVKKWDWEKDLLDNGYFDLTLYMEFEMRYGTFFEAAHTESTGTVTSKYGTIFDSWFLFEVEVELFDAMYVAHEFYL